jgi:hypothetical protein
MDREHPDEFSDPQTVVTWDRRALRVSLPANLRDELVTGRRGRVLWSAGPDGEYGTADDVVR